MLTGSKPASHVLMAFLTMVAIIYAACMLRCSLAKIIV